MSERVKVTQTRNAVSFNADQAVVVNRGPGTVYYGDQNVTATQNTGSIASGASATIAQGTHVISTSKAVLDVTANVLEWGDVRITAALDPSLPAVANRAALTFAFARASDLVTKTGRRVTVYGPPGVHPFYVQSDTSAIAIPSKVTFEMADGCVLDFSAGPTTESAVSRVLFTSRAYDASGLSGSLSAAPPPATSGANTGFSYLSKPAVRGATTLTLDTTAGLAANDWVRLASYALWDQDRCGQHGEYVQISTVDSGTQVTLCSPVVGGPYYPDDWLATSAVVGSAAPSGLAVAIASGDVMSGAGTITLLDASNYRAPTRYRIGQVTIDSEDFTYTGLDGNVLTGVTRAVNGTSAADHSVAKIDNINNANGYNASATSIKVFSGGNFSVNSVVFVPRTTELMQVSAISTNTLTVTRDYGSRGAAAALLDNDRLVIGTLVNEKSITATLAQDMTDTSGTIVLAGTGANMFPGGEPPGQADGVTTGDNARVAGVSGFVKIDNEIIFHLRRSTDGTTLGTTNNPVSRAMRGTFAAPHTAGAQVTLVNGAFVAKHVMNEDVTVIGGEIRGPSGMTPTSTAKWSGLVLEGCLRPRVQNVKFTNCNTQSVLLIDCLDFKILDNDLFGQNRNSFGYGVAVSYACQDGLISRNHIVRSRHHVTGGSEGQIGGFGIPRRITVSDNIVRDSLLTSIDNHVGCDDWVIDNNRIYDAGTAAFGLESPRFQVTNNRVWGCGSGVYVTPLTPQERLSYLIENNEFTRGTATGVTVDLSASATAPATNAGCRQASLKVRNNTFRGFDDYGIWVRNTSSLPRLDGVDVSGNTFESCAQTQHVVLSLDYCRDFSADGNKILHSLRNAITLTQCDGGSIFGGSVRYETLGTNTAISATGSNDIIISGMRVRNASVGISLANTTTYCTVMANNLRGCTTTISRGTGTGHIIATADGATAGDYNRL